MTEAGRARPTGSGAWTMSPAALDLDAYFERVGYRGPREATPATLRELHRLHPQAIPFENLDPFLRREVSLDPARLEAKLVRGRRGGYCFEQNMLFGHVLKALGFRVSGLEARVLWNHPEGSPTPRTHMLLRVDLPDGLYLADVGFGGQTTTAPLRLEVGLEQATPHEPFRIVRAGGDFEMQSSIGGTWRPLYRFDLQEQVQADYEVASLYVSTHPASPFVGTLVAARAAAEGRYALHDFRLTVHRRHGPTERRALETADDVRETLETVFGIAVPDRPRFDAALARLAPTRVGTA